MRGWYDLLAGSSPLSWDLSLFRKLDLGTGDFSVDAPINQLSPALRVLLFGTAGAGTVAGWSSTDRFAGETPLRHFSAAAGAAAFLIPSFSAWRAG
jgi:hypothetical protein